eukprot:756758-Hanusia_phi.AAC.11
MGVELVCEPQTIISRLKLCLAGQWNVDAWKQVFALGDKDNSGGLDREELRRILDHFDVSVTTEELKGLWNFIDISADAGGRIEFWELVEAFRFDDWEEELDTMMTTKKRVGPRSRKTSKTSLKYPCHAVISCADKQTAERILKELDGHSVRFHDQEGRELTPKDLLERGMLPLNRAPIVKDEQEKLAEDGKEKKQVHKSLRLALQRSGEGGKGAVSGRRAKLWKPELFWSISAMSGGEDNVRTGAPGIPGERVVTDHDKFLVAQRSWSRDVMQYHRKLREIEKGELNDRTACNDDRVLIAHVFTIFAQGIGEQQRIS